MRSRKQKTTGDRDSGSFLLRTVSTKEFNFIKSEPSELDQASKTGARKVKPTPEVVFNIKERSRKLHNFKLGSGLKKETGLFARPLLTDTIESLHQNMLDIEVNMARPYPESRQTQPADRQRASSGRVQLVYVESRVRQPLASQRANTESGAVVPSFETKTTNRDTSKEATPRAKTAAAQEQAFPGRSRSSLSRKQCADEALNPQSDYCFESSKKQASTLRDAVRSATQINSSSSANRHANPRPIKLGPEPVSAKPGKSAHPAEKPWRPLSPSSFKKLKKYQFRIIDSNPQCDLKLVPQSVLGKQQPQNFHSQFSTSNNSKEALFKRGYQLKKSETGTFQQFFDIGSKLAGPGKPRRFVPDHSHQLKRIMRKLDGIIIKYEDARHNFFGEDYKPTLYETSFVHSGQLSDLQDPSVPYPHNLTTLQSGSMPADSAKRDLLLNNVNDQLDELVNKCRVGSLKKLAGLRSSQLIKDSTPSSSKHLRRGEGSSRYLPHPTVSRFETSTHEILTQPAATPHLPIAALERPPTAAGWKSILMTTSNLQLSKREAF